MELYLFYTLAAILVTFSILTVTASNPVRSALYLISALISIAGLFFLMEAEFVGAVQILVYVGGIMVLFLFVIMLVSVREATTHAKTVPQWKTGVILGVVLSTLLCIFAVKGSQVFEKALAKPGVIEELDTRNTESVGILLYSTYLLPFEIASIVLLVAIIGAVVLAKKEI